MLSIRPGLPEDYPQLIRQVVASFRVNTPWHPGFDFNYPDCVQPTPDAMRHWRLAFVDGELAGGMIMLPRQIAFGETTVTYAGIGHVHCYPKFRKAGVFSAVIRRVIDDMNAEKIPLSMLGGDRLRYGHYGWEHAGFARKLFLEPGQGRFDADEVPPTVMDFREYQGGDEDAKKIWRAREAAFAHPVKATLGDLKSAFLRPGRVTYLCETPALGFGYMTVTQGNLILEYGGDLPAVERILKFILHAGNWTVETPPPECWGPLEELLDRYAQDLSIDNTSQLRVNNMALTLQAFAPWLRKRLADWTGRRVIAIDDGEKCAVAKTPGGDLQIDDVTGDDDAKPDMILSRRDAANLLFGPFLPTAALRSTDPFWRRAFPLPFYWPLLEHC